MGNHTWFSYVFATKVLDRNDLQKERFIWVHGSRRIQSFTDREDLADLQQCEHV